MVKYAIIENNVVKNIVVADAEYAYQQGWIDATGAKIGNTWDGDNFITPEPEPEPEPVILGILSTDKWSIDADDTDTATVTYTSESDSVFFVVNDDIEAVSPEDSIATLEITADAAGAIKVSVEDKSIVIAAVEVA